MARENDTLGGEHDSIRILIDGKLIRIAEQYEVELAILRQPCGFSLRLGSSQTAMALIAMITPRKSRYELYLDTVKIQSGIIYARSVPAAASTVLEVRGRDYMSVLWDAYMQEDRDYHEKTYRDLARRFMDEVGLTEAAGHRLVTSNDLNRLKLTGRNVKATSHVVDGPVLPLTKEQMAAREATAIAFFKQSIAHAEEAQRQADAQALFARRQAQEAQAAAQFQATRGVEGRRSLSGIADTYLPSQVLSLATPSSIVQQQVLDSLETPAARSTSTVVVQSLKYECGTRYHDAWEREAKLVGAFLWADADGNIVLARPNANQTPSFRIFRKRHSDQRGVSMVHEASWTDDTTDRHTSAIVYGRSGRGKAGRNKHRGEYVDDELKESHFNAPIVIHDRDVPDDASCEYIARRRIAEERRAGWKLVYTVAGHKTTLISAADGASVCWAPDTIVDVDDRELGISGHFYLETVKFKRDPKATTELHLMRPEDLVFAEDLFPKPIVPTPAPTNSSPAAEPGDTQP